MTLIRNFLAFIRGEQNINKLRARGLRVGQRLTRMSGVIIDPSHCWHITIGDDVILAPNVHILAHDASTKLFLNHTKVQNVHIGSRVFIGARSIILPGVTIGDDVVIGAGSIVTSDIAAGSVAAGNPAKILTSTAEYIKKQTELMSEQNVFSAEYTLRNPEFNKHHRQVLLDSCMKQGCIFVE